MPLVRTFIVEDSPVILDNLVATLEELAHVQVVGSAADEDAAVRRLREDGDSIDLMIIDMFLKSGSGLGVLQSAQELGASARRVVLTNYATMAIRLRCTELGAERVFDKSSELEDLIEYCERIAGQPSASPSGQT